MAAADPVSLFQELTQLAVLKEKYAGLHRANVTLGDTLEQQADVIHKQTGIIEELRLERDRWQAIAQAVRKEQLRLLTVIAHQKCGA